MIYKKTLHGNEALKILNFLNIPLKLKDLEIEIIIKPEKSIMTRIKMLKIKNLKKLNQIQEV